MAEKKLQERPNIWQWIDDDIQEAQ